MSGSTRPEWPVAYELVVPGGSGRASAAQSSVPAGPQSSSDTKLCSWSRIDLRTTQELMQLSQLLHTVRQRARDGSCPSLAL